MFYQHSDAGMGRKWSVQLFLPFPSVMVVKDRSVLSFLRTLGAHSNMVGTMKQDLGV